MSKVSLFTTNMGYFFLPDSKFFSSYLIESNKNSSNKKYESERTSFQIRQDFEMGPEKSINS